MNDEKNQNEEYESSGNEENEKGILFRTRILMLITALIPIALVAVLYNKLPDLIPGHWNIDSSIRYDPKWTSFITSALPLLLFTLSFVATNEKMLGINKSSSKKVQKNTICIFLFGIELLLMSLQIIVLVESLASGTLDVTKVVFLILGVFFIFTGNLLPKMPMKYINGIKIKKADKKTLSKGVKTKRLLGYVMIIAGVIFAVSSFFASVYVLLGSVCVFVVSMIVVTICVQR